MAIWHRDYSLEEINRIRTDSIVGHLGIEITGIGPDYLTGSMPVDERTRQPAGILHGGASVTLAETLGSAAANLCVNRDKYLCVGLEINANHLRAVREGMVKGIARPIHIGSSTQVWEIRIEDEEQQLVCVSRLTMAVVTLARFQGKQ